MYSWLAVPSPAYSLHARLSMSATTYRPSEFFVLRCPAHEFGEFQRVFGPPVSTSMQCLADDVSTYTHEVDSESAGARLTTSADQAPGEVQASIASGLHVVRRMLRNDRVREAITIATGDLLPARPFADESATAGLGRAEYATLRYLARLSTRATPFGTFAGVALGKIGTSTDLRIGPASLHRRHVRVDMEAVSQIAALLQAEPAIRRSLVYFSNTSLSRRHRRYHFVESIVQQGQRRHALSAADASPELDLVLSAARYGKSFSELVTLLEAPDLDSVEIESYLEELITSQLLISELDPVITGGDALEQVIRTLSVRVPDATILPALEGVRQALNRLNGSALGVNMDAYADAHRVLDRIVPHIPSPRRLQVDLALQVTHASLGQGDAERLILAALDVYAMAPQVDPLGGFRLAFRERYDRRAVPLLEALDPEYGIGFPALFSNAASALREPKDEQRHAYLSRLVTDAARAGQNQVMLDPREISQFGASRPQGPPDAFAVHGSFVSLSKESDLLLLGAFGPSSAAWLGRFAHLDVALHAAVKQQVRAEEALQQEKSFAEILHLPEGRLGNILWRPQLRPYEIPYIAKSAAPADNQVHLDDLYVTLEEGRLALLSRRLNREIAPRLATAHNFHAATNLPVYRFLALLQGEGTQSSAVWDWGARLGGLEFLPRVVVHGVTVSRAQWRLRGAPLHSLQDRSMDHARAFDEWRERTQLPHTVSVREGDNELHFDLTRPLSYALFREHAAQKRDIVLVEGVPSEHALWS